MVVVLRGHVPCSNGCGSGSWARGLSLQLSGQGRQPHDLPGLVKPSVPGRHDDGGHRNRECTGEVDGGEAAQGMQFGEIRGVALERLAEPWGTYMV